MRDGKSVMSMGLKFLLCCGSKISSVFLVFSACILTVLSSFTATAQQELVHVTEKERSAVDFAIEMKSRVAGLESQVKTLREQKVELSSSLETLKEREKTVEEDLKK